MFYHTLRESGLSDAKIWQDLECFRARLIEQELWFPLSTARGIAEFLGICEKEKG